MPSRTAARGLRGITRGPWQSARTLAVDERARGIRRRHPARRGAQPNGLCLWEPHIRKGTQMKRFSAWLWLAMCFGCGLVIVSCSDAPTDPYSRQVGGPAFTGTTLTLNPLDVTACQYGGEYPNCKPATATRGDAGVAPTPSSDPAAPSSGGAGTAPSPDSSYSAPSDTTNDFSSRNCPQLLGGKVITAGVTVAGILHTFKFDGQMTRVSGPVSPATYSILR